MLDLCFHHEIIQLLPTFHHWPKQKCVSSALVKDFYGMIFLSTLFVSFQIPKIKVPPWGPWQSCMGINVNLGILKAHEQVGSCLEKGQCLLQHCCSTTITWWGCDGCDSWFQVLVQYPATSFDCTQYQRTKVHVVAAGPFATNLVCSLAKSDLPAAAIWCICFSESEFISLHVLQHVD